MTNLSNFKYRTYMNIVQAMKLTSTCIWSFFKLMKLKTGRKSMSTWENVIFLSDSLFMLKVIPLLSCVNLKINCHCLFVEHANC